jgi:ribosomal protein S18 acetylase RimI-like enzyme
VIVYRPFNNFDPPAILDIWNDCFPNRGAYPINNANQSLERWLFSKPYFDPAGLILALDGTDRVGFAHGGFGPNEEMTGVATDRGMVCALAVRSSHRRRGIGSELLHRCEQYLTGRGATTLYAGPIKPLNPFYFGLYGGCDTPGFLTSDAAAGPFFEYHGYHGVSTVLVFQRKLDQPLPSSDPRFPALKRRYEMQMLPRAAVVSWWNECLLSGLEPVEFRLEDKLTGVPAARATVWEMEGFSWRWQHPAAGVLDLQVRPDLRHQGIGRYLLTQVIRYLQDQYFGVLEIQAPERNPAAVGLCRVLGFQQVDVGRSYRRQEPRADTAATG